MATLHIAGSLRSDADTTDPGAGLSDDQVARRLARGEVNSSPAPTGRTYGAIVRENVFTFINNVLFVLGVALVAIGEVSDAVIAVGVVLGNIVVSVVQEVRAKRTLDRIALLTRPRTTVVREGRERAVAPSQVVRDDILVVRPGDQIVVDGPVVTASNIDVDESLLTGESDLVTKPQGETLLSGSYCVSGEARYRAERIGAESFANGLTATARRHRRSLTPLQREINVIIRVILLVAAFLELVFVIGFWIHDISLVAGVEMSVVVAKLVPAGLFLSVTLAYALGAVRIVRQGALVQQVNAVESLSNVDVLCLDKTGTLTANRFVLEAIQPIGIGEGELRQFLGMYAASTSGGNRTIAALQEACPGKATSVREEVPFSSEWKWSALTIDSPPGAVTYLLGAPEILQAVTGLPPGVGDQIESWSTQGLRVLLFACAPDASRLRDARNRPLLPETLSARGIVCFRDELRPQARETLARFAAAGVQTKLISGDNPLTVAALAAQVGLSSELPPVSGFEFAGMDEVQRAESAEHAAIFGRVTPAQKEELITLLRNAGHYVAMIGDGVNDVLSLKRSNVAVAMESGSQAARGVADIVLLGDSFETLPAAVEEGQRIQNGLRDILKLFLTRVLTVAILVIAIALLDGFPFDPKQISILTTLTVGIPSIGLAVWAKPGVVLRGSVARQIVHFVLPASLSMALAGLATYVFVALAEPVGALPRAQTALTIMAVPCGLLLLPFVSPPTKFWEAAGSLSGDRRPTILAAVLFAVFLGLLSIPSLRAFFGLTVLNGPDYLVIAAIVVAWTLILRYTWRARLLDRFLGIDLTPPP